MLYLYKLNRRAPAGYDEAHGFVIIAPSTEGARVIASSRAGDEGYATWLDPEQTTCHPVGTALEEDVPGIVLRSFIGG